MGIHRSAPAGVWRAFFLFATLAVSAMAGPQTISPAPLRQFGKPDPAEARAALDELRRLGIAGSYYLEFELRILPRRGDERDIPGRIWGMQGRLGPIARVELGSGTGAVRWLIQRGPEAAVWRYDGSGGVRKLGVAELFQPLMPDTYFTPFDLEMPYVYWARFTYEGLERFNGRPTYMIVLQPPEDFARKFPALAGLRLHLDTQYDAPVQTELLGANSVVTKTITVVDLKKVGDQWIVKTIDARDEATRNKTRLNFTAATMKVDFAEALFEPARLAQEVRPPDVALERIGR